MGFLKRIQGTAEWISDVFKLSGVLKLGQFTGADAELLTPENGDVIYITATSTVFTSVGFWIYEDGVWKKQGVAEQWSDWEDLTPANGVTINSGGFAQIRRKGKLREVRVLNIDTGTDINRRLLTDPIDEVNGIALIFPILNKSTESIDAVGIVQGADGILLGLTQVSNCDFTITFIVD
jgi:hypothetical protein